MKVKIDVYKNTAFTEEFVCTGNNPEEAVKGLIAKIKSKYGPGIIFELPYLGQTFTPCWEDIKKPKEKVEDDFELAQKITYKLNKDLA